MTKGIETLIDAVPDAPVKGFVHGVRARPFVKWAGGKRSLIPDLLKCLPSTIGDYWEPFVGGGAMFYAIESGLQRAHLSDMNAELMIAYQMVKKQVEPLIQKLEQHLRLHSPEHYAAVRKDAKADNSAVQAARFIYLNKTCYNGLYRVNRAGLFNVPMGKYKNPAIVDANNLRSASAALGKAILKWEPFEQIKPKAGDLVYCDPPYDETYDQYTRLRFNGTGQQKLAKRAVEWHKMGAAVIISNSDTPLIRELYKTARWKIHTVTAVSNINCKAAGRGARQEIIITNAG